MFKGAVDKFFSWTYLKRMLTLAIVVATLFGLFDFFVFGIIRYVLPKQEVYSFFNSLATDIVKSKNTDFLEHLDNLDYLENLEGLEYSDVSEISKNPNVLQYYIVTKNSKENLIKVEMYGYHHESIVLMVSSDYKLISLKKGAIIEYIPNPIVAFVIYVSIAIFVSNILDLILMGLKLVVEYCSRSLKHFRENLKNKKANTETGTDSALHSNYEVVIEGEPEDQGDQCEDSEESEEDDDKYSASDYEF